MLKWREVQVKIMTTPVERKGVDNKIPLSEYEMENFGQLDASVV